MSNERLPQVGDTWRRISDDTVTSIRKVGHARVTVGRFKHTEIPVISTGAPLWYIGSVWEFRERFVLVKPANIPQVRCEYCHRMVDEPLSDHTPYCDALHPNL